MFLIFCMGIEVEVVDVVEFFFGYVLGIGCLVLIIDLFDVGLLVVIVGGIVVEEIECMFLFVEFLVEVVM